MRAYNFSSGPATLPLSVIEEVQSEFSDYHGRGASIIEMSHRSPEFLAINEKAEMNIRQLLGVSDEYAVIFVQGGASLQFSMVPMNLKSGNSPALLVQTGAWTEKAEKEIAREMPVKIIASSAEENYTCIPAIPAESLEAESAFTYICSNNTIFGTQYREFPDAKSPLVADMSSDILSRSLDVSKFSLIFAGAQKNIGPAGVAVVIIRRDLAERGSKDLPTMLQYRTHIANQSLYNTAPVFPVYVMEKVTSWIIERGGLPAMEQFNREKAALLYAEIDRDGFYRCPVRPDSRSDMNVVFRVAGGNEALEKKFVTEAEAAGLKELKGHRSVGGLRASIYNAMPREGVTTLIEFMQHFRNKNG